MADPGRRVAGVAGTIEWLRGDATRPLCVPPGCPPDSFVAHHRLHRWRLAISPPGDPERHVCRRCGCVRLRVGRAVRYVAPKRADG